MAIVIDFVRRLAPWVYGACVLMALWYLRVVILARRERRYAVFKLERETALNRVYSAWLAAIVIITLVALWLGGCEGLTVKPEQLQGLATQTEQLSGKID